MFKPIALVLTLAGAPALAGISETGTADPQPSEKAQRAEVLAQIRA